METPQSNSSSGINPSSSPAPMPTDDLPSQTVGFEVSAFNNSKPNTIKESEITKPTNITPQLNPLQPNTKQKKKKKTLFFLGLLIFLLVAFITIYLLSMNNSNKNSENTNPPTNVSCVYGNKTYSQGAVFASTDGCNTCGCGADGEISCTLIGCGTDSNEGITPVSDPIVNPL